MKVNSCKFVHTANDNQVRIQERVLYRSSKEYKLWKACLHFLTPPCFKDGTIKWMFCNFHCWSVELGWSFGDPKTSCQTNYKNQPFKVTWRVAPLLSCLNKNH